MLGAARDQLTSGFASIAMKREGTLASSLSPSLLLDYI
jgi:hypothetical protein